MINVVMQCVDCGGRRRFTPGDVFKSTEWEVRASTLNVFVVFSPRSPRPTTL